MQHKAFAALSIACFTAVTVSFSFTNHVSEARSTGFFTAILIGIELARELIEHRRSP